MILFQRLGQDLPEVLAKERRAEFLKKLIRFSKNGFADKMVTITPCDPVEAYFAFTAITGCLQVDVDLAARMLEEEVRRQ